MTEKLKPQPKQQNPKPDDSRESKRFIDTARQIEVDESGKAFWRAFETIVPPRSTK